MDVGVVVKTIDYRGEGGDVTLVHTGVEVLQLSALEGWKQAMTVREQDVTFGVP